MVYLSSYFIDLEFEIPPTRKIVREIKDINKLIEWANTKNIPTNLIPRDKVLLLQLETLDLSNLSLTKIPKEIRVLKNLSYLNLSNNNLEEFPLDIIMLHKLQVLHIEENNISYIPPEVYIILNQTVINISTNKTELCSLTPLSFSTLESANNLIKKIFSPQNKYDKLQLIASLEKNKYADVYEHSYLCEVSYWVVKDPSSTNVIAIIGIYTEPNDDEKNCWLGWFGVDKEFRGQGYGKRLLAFAENKAIESKKSTLSLYAYKSKKYLPAQKLYLQNGFKIYENLNSNIKKNIYFKKQLKSNP